MLFLLCSYMVFSNPCIPLSALGCPWDPSGRGMSSSRPGSENPFLEGKIHPSGGVPGPRPRSRLIKERRKGFFGWCQLPPSCCRGAEGSGLLSLLGASRAGRGWSRPWPADKTYLRKMLSPIRGHIVLLK